MGEERDYKDWLEVAREYVGKPAHPFNWKENEEDGTRHGNPGYCCSGLVLTVLEESGFEIPMNPSTNSQVRNSEEILRYMTEPISIEELTPGDLVFFADNKSNAQHVAFYLGDDNSQRYILHSPGKKGREVESVKIEDSGYDSSTKPIRKGERTVYGDENPVIGGRLKIADNDGGMKKIDNSKYCNKGLEFYLSA